MKISSNKKRDQSRSQWRHHVDRVKVAAAGRWLEIITALAAIPPVALNGQHHRCAKCGGTDRFRALNDFDQTGAVFCNQCFNSKNGDGIAAVMHFRDVGFREAVSLIGEFVGVSRNDGQQTNASVPDAEPELSSDTPEASQSSEPQIKATTAELDSAYRIILKHSPLSDAHRKQLHARGLTDADIERCGYATMLPASQRSLVATEIGATVENRHLIPGVLTNRLGIAGPEGLLVPVRNTGGQIIALKIRRDAHVGPKYCYLSSRSTKTPDRPTPGTPPHVPLGIVSPAEIVRLTEGELKADVAFSLSGVPTISFAGVNQWASALEVAKQLAAKIIRVAFDADASINFAVGSNLLACAEAIVAAGLQLQLERWPISDGNGLDDLLVAGKQPELLTGNEALAAAREIASVASVAADAQIAENHNPDAQPTKSVQPAFAEAVIKTDSDGEISLRVAGRTGKSRREVTARYGNARITDIFNTSSAAARKKFWRALAVKAKADDSKLEQLADDRLVELAEQADALQSEHRQQADLAAADDDKNQATLAVELLEDAELFHTASHETYAIVVNQEFGHQETWAIRSSMFRRYLGGLFFKEYNKPLNSESLAAAINALDAQASHCSDERPIAIRVTEQEGKIFLDLCNPQWQLVEISGAGWKVVEAADSPVRFRRSKGALPLPVPQPGGSISKLKTLFNTDDDTFPLIVSWLVAALRPGIQYPILTLFAEQGTGKSTTSRMIRSIIDPNESPLRSEPRDERDLMIAARNSLVLAFDNLSYVSPWMSDAMCRISTGGGFATRTLYENDEETIFNATRPSLITSIEDIATKSDLLDRTIIVRLPAINEEKRRPESELWAEYETARPKILGALLDAVACGLRNFPTTKLVKMPRMADFAKWVVACEPALGWPIGQFLLLYNANRDEANELALEATPVAKTLLEHLDKKKSWEGTTSELLNELNQRAGYGGDSKSRPPRGWPSVPRVLSGQLKRLSPNLRSIGWSIEHYRDGAKSSKKIRFTATGGSSDSATAATDAFGVYQTVVSNGSYVRSQSQNSQRPPATANGHFATGDHDPFATEDNCFATGLRPQFLPETADFPRDSASTVAAVAPVARSATPHGVETELFTACEEGLA